MLAVESGKDHWSVIGLQQPDRHGGNRPPMCTVMLIGKQHLVVELSQLPPVAKLQKLSWIGRKAAEVDWASKMIIELK